MFPNMACTVETEFARIPVIDCHMHVTSIREASKRALEKIYCSNFNRIVGFRPRKLQLDLAVEECKRLAREEAFLSLKPLEETVAWLVAEKMRSLTKSS
jgi:hypothetical protein